MSAEVCIEHDRGVGVGHVGPALEHRVVLVDDGTHHRADVERLLPVRVGFRREDVADGGEVARRVDVRVDAHVAVDRVGRLRLAGETLAGSNVGMGVVPEEHLDCGGQVRGPVLCLAVGPMTRS